MKVLYKCMGEALPTNTAHSLGHDETAIDSCYFPAHSQNPFGRRRQRLGADGYELVAAAGGARGPESCCFGFTPARTHGRRPKPIGGDNVDKCASPRARNAGKIGSVSKRSRTELSVNSQPPNSLGSSVPSCAIVATTNCLRRRIQRSPPGNKMSGLIRSAAASRLFLSKEARQRSIPVFKSPKSSMSHACAS
jgi:hypothetical protein